MPQKSGSDTFVFLWFPNFMQKIRKILREVSDIFKDGPQTGVQKRSEMLLPKHTNICDDWNIYRNSSYQSLFHLRM